MLAEKIDNLIMEARRAGENTRVLVFQAIKNEFIKWNTVEADKRKPLDEAAEISILKKMLKSRQESIEIYEKAGRTELAENEKKEASVISEFIPAAPSEEDMRKAIDEYLAIGEPLDKKHMGACIKFVKSKLSTVDGKALSMLVQSLINQ